MTSNSRHGGKLSKLESRVSMDEIRSYAFELRQSQIADPSELSMPKSKGSHKAVYARQNRVTTHHEASDDS